MTGEAQGAAVRVLLVGCPHLANPGRDLLNVDMDDVLSPDRQAQIERLTGGLARFAPTLIAVEYPATDQAVLTQAYRDYRSGAIPASRSEIQQIGFRLAALLGHERVAAIDWNPDLGNPDPLAYAREHEPLLYADFERLAAELTQHYVHQLTGPLTRAFAYLNSAEAILRDQKLYTLTATMGVAADYAGATWVAGWARRNLCIFANLTHAVTPGDRVLVLYGAGHLAELTRAITTHDQMTLEPTQPYLTSPP